MSGRVFAVVGLVLVAGVRAKIPPSHFEGRAPAAKIYGGQTLQQTSGQAEMAVPQTATATEGDFVAKDFRFRDGETVAELRLHYRTLGRPARDSAGRVSNAV